MKSYTTLSNLFTSLAQNTSATNVSLAKQLISDQARYLIQKYFDNERSFQTTTVGSMTLTLTGTLALNAVSATLSVAWAYPTGTQLVNFSNSNQRTALFTNGSTAITWVQGLTSTATATIGTVGFQGYNIPANVSKIKNDTINVGQLKFVPAPIMSRAEWDQINFLPYNSDIPNYFFIYQGQVLFWPIPSTTGNIITFNYKARVPDLSIADYSTGTIASGGMIAGSTSITGASTNWNTSGLFPLNVDVSYLNLYLRVDPPNGDGIWYPIYKFNTDTTLTLVLPAGISTTTGTTPTYTIGQMPLLHEDFEDAIIYGALRIYFASIVPDKNKYASFDAEYKMRLTLMEDYLGTKSVNVDLGAQPRMSNPNLYPYANG